MDTTEDGRGHQVAESFGKYAGRADSAGGAQDSALLLLDIVPRLSIYHSKKNTIIELKKLLGISIIR